MKKKSVKITIWIIALLGILVFIMAISWSSMINLMLPADSRPGKIHFPAQKVSASEFDRIAQGLEGSYGKIFNHIKRFREAGILSYDGPETCLKCHAEITITDLRSGESEKVDLMDNLTHSAHYRFYTREHPNVYGFNGKLADDFAMGKIDRPCPKPGSFAMTAWADFVIKDDGDTLSEGCGQCHIGGEYQAPVAEMMPWYHTRQSEKDAIDCLICHAVAYDMNKKQVVTDVNGRKRWSQDRSMTAALSVTHTTSQACLRCHQHNMGGDIYIDPADSSYMESQLNTGKERPRVLHPGSKRGTPFSPSWDVHAAAGINCSASTIW